MLENAIYGRIRDRMNSLQRVVCIVSHTAGISQQENKENKRAWRQLAQPIQHVTERQIVQPGEMDPVREDRKVALKCGHPILFQRRRTNHDSDVRGRRRHLENVFHKSRYLVNGTDEGGILFQRIRWQSTPVQAAVNDGGIRKETIPEL